MVAEGSVIGAAVELAFATLEAAPEPVFGLGGSPVGSIPAATPPVEESGVCPTTFAGSATLLTNASVATLVAIPAFGLSPPIAFMASETTPTDPKAPPIAPPRTVPAPIASGTPSKMFSFPKAMFVLTCSCPDCKFSSPASVAVPLSTLPTLEPAPTVFAPVATSVAMSPNILPEAKLIPAVVTPPRTAGPENSECALPASCAWSAIIPDVCTPSAAALGAIKAILDVSPIACFPASLAIVTACCFVMVPAANPDADSANDFCMASLKMFLAIAADGPIPRIVPGKLSAPAIAKALGFSKYAPIDGTKPLVESTICF